MSGLIGDGLVVLLLLTGSGFFLAGTVGMLRFPDTHTRLHALTRADTLGLCFTVAGLAVAGRSVSVGVELLAIWFIAMLASSTICYLIAQRAKRTG